MMDVKSQTQVIEILKNFGFNQKNINLEDGCYRIMPQSYFEPKLFGSTTLKKILGFKAWTYSLGASDCGKFCISYQAEIQNKFRDKLWGTSGGGDSGSISNNQISTDEEPALLMGFVKYRTNAGNSHIVNGTIINVGGRYVPMFFQRTSNGFEWVILSEGEKKCLEYFHAY